MKNKEKQHKEKYEKITKNHEKKKHSIKERRANKKRKEQMEKLSQKHEFVVCCSVQSKNKSFHRAISFCGMLGRFES